MKITHSNLDAIMAHQSAHESVSSPPQTIGRHIDAVIAKLDSLPSSYIYALAIAASLTFSFYLLNSGGGSNSIPMNPHDDVDGERAIKIPKQKKSQRSSDEPQPKWHILKLTNYVATSGFLLSILKFASNASMYLNDSTSLLQFLTLWSIFLCYFFGFFGISFIELDDFEQEAPLQHKAPVSATNVSHSKHCVSMKSGR